MWSPTIPGRYIGHNRSKKSIAINLKEAKGREILYSLVEKTDVVIEANRPGILKRRGLDYETMSKFNYRLIYCSITGYGQDGPYAQRSGHEINFAGIAGIMALTGSRNGPPVYLQSPSIADLLGGVTNAVIAINAALFAREKTGRGQYIDISITDGAAFYHWIDAQQYLLDGKLPERPESATGSDYACMNVYQAADGKYFTIGCAEPWLWEGLCRLVGREEYVSHHYAPPEKQKEMYESFAGVFITKERDEWLKLLDEIDVSVSPVYDFKEMFADPHFRHRGITVEVEHPRLGKINMLNTPFKFSETPAGAMIRPPLWGEHTREVLSSLLGYSKQEISRFIEEGIIE